MQKISATLEKQHTMSDNWSWGLCTLYLYNYWETGILNNAFAYRKLHYLELKGVQDPLNTSKLCGFERESYTFSTPSDVKTLIKRDFSMVI